MKRLVVIPTFNEAQNIAGLLATLLSLNDTFDILVVDDSSPDGTGAIVVEIAKSQSRVKLLSRPLKSGIGGAHRDGILNGYENGYAYVATMDADLTHAPADLLRLFDFSERYDVVVASRFISPGSLPGWNLWRRLLTYGGHILTRFCLGIPYDATGALRVYKIEAIPRRLFKLANSTGYSFIFEILFLLFVNGYSVHEVPVILPGRILGSSKMSMREIKKSIQHLFEYLCMRMFLPERLRIVSCPQLNAIPDGAQSDMEWDNYWGRREGLISLFYDILAGFYRRLFIRPAFRSSVRKVYAKGSKLLHAGCGSGQVDMNLARDFSICALDNSKRALELYVASNGPFSDIVHGSILELPFPDRSFDGVYNLGVMEHFPLETLKIALGEFRRVLKPGGSILLWWPPEFGSSVFILKMIKKVLSFFGREEAASLFPEECSRIESKAQIEELLKSCGFRLTGFHFGPMDMFTQVAVVATPDRQL